MSASALSLPEPAPAANRRANPVVPAEAGTPTTGKTPFARARHPFALSLSKGRAKGWGGVGPFALREIEG